MASCLGFLPPPATLLRRRPATPAHGTLKRRLSVTRRAPRCAATAADAAHVRRCVELAARGAGQTRPNPMVGCVLMSADGGTVLAEGWHTRAGRRHAEAEALHAAEAAGVNVAGATAYVSLEPCNHTGRTPPCAAALVAANVARVVVGMVDPDPRTAGAGVERMRAAGIEVEVGVEEAACRRLNEGFVHRVERGAPLGILKYAMTLDGKIAAEDGSSKWVTGATARARVHDLRAGVDAIIVGGQTLRADDARLTVRQEGGSEAEGARGGGDGYGDPPLAPLRVVLSQSLDLPLGARLWADAATLRTVVVTAAGGGARARAAATALRARGVEVVETGAGRPADAMRFLHEQGALSVLWECGGRLAAAALADGCVQKVHAFIAPKLVGGGAAAPTPVAAPAVAARMPDALELVDVEYEQFGRDLLVTGYLPPHAARNEAK